MPVTPSPLRYPGGKTALAPFLRAVIKENGLKDPVYAEPYCGGAGAAITLLFQEVASELLLNDIDPAIYSFWWAVLKRPDDLIEELSNLPISIEEWHRQKKVYTTSRNRVSLKLAVATLFLNRANRSGIILAGPIGGHDQAGRWKVGARFNKEAIIAKIRRISEQADRITIFREDALDFLKLRVNPLKGHSLTYLDPPYYVKGQSLYRNFYVHDDHEQIAKYVTTKFKHHAIISYDDCPSIRSLYRGLDSVSYGINYTAQDQYFGREILIATNGTKLPSEIDPLAVGRTNKTRQARGADELKRARRIQKRSSATALDRTVS